MCRSGRGNIFVVVGFGAAHLHAIVVVRTLITSIFFVTQRNTNFEVKIYINKKMYIEDATIVQHDWTIFGLVMIFCL